MRVFANEMKKIWNWKTLTILAIACVLFYNSYLEFYINHYKNGWPSTTEIEYCEKLTRLYGNNITEEEFADFVKNERKTLIAQAEKYIKSMPVFAAARIYSYADIEALRDADREETQEETNARLTLLGEECEYLDFKFQSLEYLEERMEYLADLLMGEYPELWNTFSEREQTRITEIVQNGENHAVLSYFTYYNTSDYILYFSILLILSVLTLVSPLLTIDRHKKVHNLQYSSKTGRKIIYSQLIAILLSSFVLTTFMILVFGSVYSVNGIYLFWNANINSNFNHTYSAFSLTYGQWVTAVIAILYALTLGAAMLAFILSRYSRSLITLAMKLIPMFVGLLLLCIVIFKGLFTMSNVLYMYTQIMGIEAYVCGIVDLTGLMALFIARREKQLDVS